MNSLSDENNNTKTYEKYVVPIFPRVQVINGGSSVFLSQVLEIQVINKYTKSSTHRNVQV